MDNDSDEGHMMADDSQMEGMMQQDMYGMEEGDMEEGDMEYGDEMMGSDEEGDHMDHREMGDDSYGMEGSPDGQYDEGGSINFDENPAFANMPPLDKMRKIRRDIIRSINDLREQFETPGVYTDVIANKAATEYAEYLLENEEDLNMVNEICNKHLLVGGVIPLVGFAMLEEEESEDKQLYHEFMDAHGLLTELEDEVGKMTDGKVTHVGVGFAWNKQCVKVVEFLSIKPLLVNQLTESEDGGVDIRGMMLDLKAGIYAARICSAKNLKKDLKLVGPPNIQFDKNTKTFIISVEGPADNIFYSDDPKIVELYIRTTQIDKIQYGVASQERLNIQHLQLAMRLPMEYIPDPRTVIEDAQDREKEERDADERRKRGEEERMVKEAQKLARYEEKKKQREELAARRADGADVESLGSSTLYSEKSGSKRSQFAGGKQSADNKSAQSPHGQSQHEASHLGKSKAGSERHSMGRRQSQDQSGSDGAEDDDDVDDDQKEESMDEMPSQNEMKRELIIAIEEELREQEALKKQNEELQRQIIVMNPTYDQQDKQPDVSTNEYKYLNTLANVHQVRFNLKETQDRYNKMASELQAKLNEKQAKCHEIEQQFKELKRSVAQNAVFSRTGKKIQKKTLDEWEEVESLKDQEVHQYRLQNIALRNRLANKEKILKKKEQLADGLHLIDFEQLKIENQTLNEKIEERNEDLHKLRQKITKTVVVLSHTREKLQYVQEQNKLQNDKLQDLNHILNKEKNALSTLKKSKEDLLKRNQKLKQQTGIVSKESLKDDYDAREKEKKMLEERINGMKDYHLYLTRVNQRANQLQMSKMTN